MRETVTARELARVLHEPCPWMLSRALRTLGAECCVAILIDTLSIESNGGMWTKDGSRRRSPGGTFLQLVRRVKTPAGVKAMLSRLRVS